MKHSTRVVLRVVIGLLVLCAIGVLVTYSILAPVRATGPASKRSEANEPSSDAALPNPASAHCEEKGYTLEMRTSAEGGQYGVCIFPEGSECEEWAFYRGECGPAGQAGETLMPTLALNPDTGSPGQAIQVNGTGFAPGASIALRLGVPNAGLSKVNLATAIADASGAFEATLALPTEWPGAQTPIVERELVIAAVDETKSETLAIAPFTNADAETVECFGDCMIFARDTALAYVADNYGEGAPAPDLSWELTSMAESIAAQGSPGERAYEFIAGSWTVKVSYPIGSSGPVVYAVQMTHQDTGFRWEGTVDTHGNVTE
jgi:putative hemolysin